MLPPHLLPAIQALGFHESEAKAYLTLLQTGTTTASVLAKRMGIKRPAAHYTLSQLYERQVVTRIEKNGVFHFTPDPPERLINLLEHQQQSIEHQKSSITQIMGDLNKLSNPYSATPKVKFFEGVDGVIRLFEDVLQPEVKTLYGALKKDQNTHPEIDTYLSEHYIPKRIELGSNAYMLFNDTPETRAYQDSDEETNRTTLLVSPSDFPFDTCCHCYQNKLVFYNYLLDNTFGVMIESSNVNQTFLSFFRIMWNALRLTPENKKHSKVVLP